MGEVGALAVELKPEVSPATSPRTADSVRAPCGADDAADVTHAFTVHGAELALAMVHGYKLVENRTRKFTVGWYALHVGLQDTEHARRAAGMYSELLQGNEASHYQSTVVGLVRVSEHRAKEECNDHVWAIGPVCNVISATVILGRPVAARGNRGQWLLPADARSNILAQLEEGDCLPLFFDLGQRGGRPPQAP